MLTDEQLRTWKRATDAATPGPPRWVDGLGLRSEGVSLDDNSQPVPYAPSEGGGSDVYVVNDPYVFHGLTPDADRAFFATAREAMPALLDEVERLRTPTGAVGRVGFDAFAQQRQADGLPPGHAWETMEKDVPRWTRAWSAAGQAERAVAYALAAHTLREEACPGCIGLADDIRALSQPPANAAERMARIQALLREASALAGEVLADCDAAPEMRATAEAIRTRLDGDADEEARLAGLKLWHERFRHGPPGPEVPSAAECLRDARVATRTGLDLVCMAARRASSLPMGRALAALEKADAQLDAAMKLDQDLTPSGRGLVRLSVPGPADVRSAALEQIREANRRARASPEGSPDRARWEGFASGAANVGAVLLPDPPPVAEESPRAQGLRELTQLSEEIGNYFGDEDAEKTPTTPVEPMKDTEE